MAFIRSVIAGILIFATIFDEMRRLEYLRWCLMSVIDYTDQEPSIHTSLIKIGCMNQKL